MTSQQRHDPERNAAVLLSGRVMLWGWLHRQSSVLQPFDSERIY